MLAGSGKITSVIVGQFNREGPLQGALRFQPQTRLGEYLTGHSEDTVWTDPENVYRSRIDRPSVAHEQRLPGVNLGPGPTTAAFRSRFQNLTGTLDFLGTRQPDTQLDVDHPGTQCNVGSVFERRQA